MHDIAWLYSVILLCVSVTISVYIRIYLTLSTNLRYLIITNYVDFHLTLYIVD